MINEKLVKAILDDYKKEFDADPSDDCQVKGFRQGVIFAYNYLLTVVKNGHEDIYLKEGEI